MHDGLSQTALAVLSGGQNAEPRLGLKVNAVVGFTGGQLLASADNL